MVYNSFMRAGFTKLRLTIDQSNSRLIVNINLSEWLVLLWQQPHGLN